MVVPHELHPLFQVSKGKQHQPLQVQAALFLLLLTGASHAQCRLLLQVNHRMIEGMSSRLQVLRQSYVQEEEQKIIFGDGKKWMDVEADEATFDRADVTRDVTYKDSVVKGKPILWEQWCGILARGNPKTLVLTCLTPVRQNSTWSNPQGGLDPIGPEASCRSQTHFAR